MLKGRESLARLISKRRRFLPNHHSILPETIQSSLKIGKDENGGTDDVTCPEEAPSAIVDKVICPVCGDKVRGEDYMINSHLGFNAAVAGCFFAIETVLRPLRAENSPPFTTAMIILTYVISSTGSNVVTYMTLLI